jgi:hypothetical protein
MLYTKTYRFIIRTDQINGNIPVVLIYYESAYQRF